MKSSLSLLLAASLLGNVGFAVYTLRSSLPATTTASTRPASAATAATSPARTSATVTTTASAPLEWRAPRTTADMRDVVAKLRAAGCPPSILRAVVNQMLQDRFRDPGTEETAFWKRSRQTPEVLTAQLAKGKEMNALREELLGPDGTPAAMLNQAERTRRYGNLSDEKINALLKLDQEYSEVRSMAYAARDRSTTSGRDMAEQQRALEAEKRADLAAVLTPAELEQYDMRNSNAAQRMMGNLRNVDVSEAEYAQLYQIQKAHDAANPERGETNGPEGYANRLVGQAELNEQARAVLGEERFYKYLEGADPTYANISRFAAQQPNISQATTYQLYQMQNEMMLSMASLGANGNGTSGEQRMAQARALAETYNSRLTSLIGAEAAEAYKKQGTGRMFNLMGQGRPRNVRSNGGN